VDNVLPLNTNDTYAQIIQLCSEKQAPKRWKQLVIYYCEQDKDNWNELVNSTVLLPGARLIVFPTRDWEFEADLNFMALHPNPDSMEYLFTFVSKLTLSTLEFSVTRNRKNAGNRSFCNFSVPY
jgi:hypothetical protein